jgi:1-phosphofructokinase family hexose kinase
MILTFLPNPSLDKVFIVPGFRAGDAFHAERVSWYAGGKGAHFGRALRTLGAQPLLVGPLGGHTGQFVAELARAEGLHSDFVWIEEHTRTGLVVFDPLSNRVSELYEPGPQLSHAEWQRLLEMVIAHLPQAQLLAVCGSFPQGAPEDALAGLVRQAHKANVPVLLDTYGSLAKNALVSQPQVIKINLQEAADLLGRVVSNQSEAGAAAREIQERGAQAVIITLGSQGAVGVGPDGVFAWASPSVASIFPVGSGDSFFAGLVYGLVNGMPLDQATRLGVATGAANTLEIGPGVLDKRRVDELLPQIQPL